MLHYDGGRRLRCYPPRWGEAIALDAAKKVPATLGDIVVTTAGFLSAQYIFHAITIGPSVENLSAGAVVERTTRRCMQLLEGLQLSSIAFPAIGAGSAGFSYEEVAARMAEVIADELLKRQTPTDATIFLFDRFDPMTELDYIRFFEEFAGRAPRVASKMTPDVTPVSTLNANSVDLVAETEEEYKRRRIHNLRRLLAELEDQRGKVEQRLIGLLGTDRSKEEQLVRKALAQNQELRLQYLNELQSYAAQPADAPATRVHSEQPLTVFVSSTSLDLTIHRVAVKDAIARSDLFFRGMEHFGAAPDGIPPATLIVEEVRKADVYLGIFGVRYGSVDPATGLSMTELEFREAEAGKKPMLLYVMHQDAPISVAHIETDPEGYRKLSALKDPYFKKLCSVFVRNVDDLGRQAYSDLFKLKTRNLHGERPDRQ